MTFRLSLCWILISLSFGSRLLATSFGPVEDTEIESPNGKYTLKIDASSQEHSIYRGKKQLWSFKRPVWHDEYFLSDDGNYVLWISWPYMNIEEIDKPAAILYYPRGVRKTWSYRKFGTPRKYRKMEVGPVGEFWRIWRESATQRGKNVQISLSNGTTKTLTLSSEH